ncbi:MULTISPECIES: helix-turn-helix domain-containing protein [Streptomyces]|uniref:Helix-turn-helix domain-containing protein n=1 Tax=Streptomyces ardesiacus TaxID=285564 RepID=A0ABW8H3Q9_9ACTN|nr:MULTISPECIES: helix-turn-helix transcriptional regulator [Streptomyces]NEB62203.1 helix-turn-helix transcriptional regulator [Streptomyces diastaticus]KOT98416.1 DNA-binding protein [Streptomyces sp. NRRL F-4711]KOX38995.1 DNA-binding protein [Streptomyces sp. NRRL F-4707]KOX46314.1 DNA-binding protein [Streptomyces sp. NRRL F-7442]MCL7370018.1 helix-turn-helix domain-containing protein [Streptomyces ardesiacus]
MNHSTWRTRRARQLAGEAVEYDQEYVDARLAGDLGQAVYDRRIELGLSQTELAERAGMTQPQVSRMEGGDTVPTLPLLRRLAKALDGTLNLAIDEGDSRVTFTPHAA